MGGGGGGGAICVYVVQAGTESFVSGTIFRLKGAIVGMSFLDCNGILIQSVFDQWKDSGGSGSSGSGGGGGGSSTNLVSYGKEKDNRDAKDDKALKGTSKLVVVCVGSCSR